MQIPITQWWAFSKCSVIVSYYRKKGNEGRIEFQRPLKITSPITCQITVICDLSLRFSWSPWCIFQLLKIMPSETGPLVLPANFPLYYTNRLCFLFYLSPQSRVGFGGGNSGRRGTHQHSVRLCTEHWAHSHQKPPLVCVSKWEWSLAMVLSHTTLWG